MDCYGISKPRLMVPMVSIAAIYSLFPDTRKCFDMIFVYGIRMPPTRNRLPQEPPQREDL
jgi:hypothetical protein